MKTPHAITALLLLGACAQPAKVTAPDPQVQFWQALASHCGQAYGGRLVSDDAADADMQGAAMVMQVRDCSDTGIAVPFHIQQADGSWNRSRTWLFTKTGTGLRLKHDHRHEDGSADAVTMYGGDTADKGTGRAQEFPVDRESIDLFTREGLDVSVTNVWRVEVDPATRPAAQFAYQLRRAGENARLFRVEFDLSSPVPPPPPPWGS